MHIFQAQDWPETIGLYISQFPLLTSLHLDKVPIQCKTIISVLGKSCPRLKFLRLGFDNFPLSTDEFLSIFYCGDLSVLKNLTPDVPSIENLHNPANEHKKAYNECCVPPHLLYSFCHTLEEIRINYFNSDEPYVIAFILRHLPVLQKLETSDFEFKDYTASIRSLWDTQNRENHQESADESMELSLPTNSDSIVQKSFSGKLL
jgi:hypothetical protein